MVDPNSTRFRGMLFSLMCLVIMAVFFLPGCCPHEDGAMSGSESKKNTLPVITCTAEWHTNSQAVSSSVLPANSVGEIRLLSRSVQICPSLIQTINLREDGTVLSVDLHSGDILHGPCYTFREDGQIAAQREFRNGRLHGTVRRWSRDGKEIKQSVWSNGVPIDGVVETWNAGHLVSSVYSNGVLCQQVEQNLDPFAD